MARDSITDLRIWNSTLVLVARSGSRAQLRNQRRKGVQTELSRKRSDYESRSRLLGEHRRQWFRSKNPIVRNFRECNPPADVTGKYDLDREKINDGHRVTVAQEQRASGYQESPPRIPASPKRPAHLNNHVRGVGRPEEQHQAKRTHERAEQADPIHNARCVSQDRQQREGGPERNTESDQASDYSTSGQCFHNALRSANDSPRPVFTQA